MEKSADGISGVSAQLPLHTSYLLQRGGATAVVTLLGVSNGTVPATPTSLSVPPGRTVSAFLATNWRPVEFPPLWVVHLNVPDGVVIQSRAEAFSTLCPPSGAPPSPVPDLGSFQLPIARALTPAGTTRILLGADLGAEASTSNVGVFNAGASSATAVIEVHQACDDSILDRQAIVVPPNSLVQVGGVGGEPSCPGPPTPAPSWIKYVAVTVDQDSFSYVVNKSADLPTKPLVPYGSSLSD